MFYLGFRLHSQNQMSQSRDGSRLIKTSPICREFSWTPAMFFPCATRNHVFLGVTQVRIWTFCLCQGRTPRRHSWCAKQMGESHCCPSPTNTLGFSRHLTKKSRDATIAMLGESSKSYSNLINNDKPRFIPTKTWTSRESQGFQPIFTRKMRPSPIPFGVWDPRHQRTELHGKLLEQTHAFQAAHGEEDAQEEQGIRNLPVVVWCCLYLHMFAYTHWYVHVYVYIYIYFLNI